MEFCDGMMVTVQQGDTLYSLSMRYQVPLAVLLRANPYVDVYNLQVGERICVPMRRRPMPMPMVPGGEDGMWRETDRQPDREDGMWREPDRQPDRREDLEEFLEDRVEEIQDRIEDALEQRPVQRPVPEQRPSTRQRVPEESQMMPTQEMEMRMQTELEETNIEDNRNQWERYVTKQGDTLDIVVGPAMGRDNEWEELLEEFVERNGRDKIYLLPGVAYYRRK